MAMPDMNYTNSAGGYNLQTGPGPSYGGGQDPDLLNMFKELARRKAQQQMAPPPPMAQSSFGGGRSGRAPMPESAPAFIPPPQEEVVQTPGVLANFGGLPAAVGYATPGSFAARRGMF